MHHMTNSISNPNQCPNQAQIQVTRKRNIRNERNIRTDSLLIWNWNEQETFFTRGSVGLLLSAVSIQEYFLPLIPFVVRALVAACAANAQGVAMLLERC